MGSKKAKMDVTQYFMSVHLGICSGPVDALQKIFIGDKEAWVGEAAAEAPIAINKPDLFGGIKKEGGAQGQAHYLPGHDAQILPEVLAGKLGLTSATCPAYRGIASLFFHGGPQSGFYWTANSPYLRGVWAKVRRMPVGLSRDNVQVPRKAAGNLSIYFLLDRSLSLSTSELNTIKDAVRASLTMLEEHKTANPSARVDVGVRFYSDGSTAIERTNCDSSDFNAIRNFIDAAGRVYGGDVLSAMNHVRSWFDATASAKLDKRALVFVTDTETEDNITAAASGPAAALLDRNINPFSVSSGNAVDLYAINFGSTNTTWTPLLDNTPEDGVPVISRTDSSGLTDAVSRCLRGREVDANPAHIIYECLTNTDWGMGAPSSSIDIPSFEAAAVTLFSEGLGLSLLWAQQSTIEEFVTTIINHIEATLFINPRTGLFTLKLIRGDYDIDDLPVISPDNANLDNFQRKLWGETINEIVVSWKNPDNEETETVSAQDLANIAMQGAIVSDSKNYEGVRSAALAMKLAMRDLRAASSPMISCDAIVNRQGWDVTPGSVVALSWPEHGIEKVAMRVGPVDYGRTTDSKIKLSLVEDVFGLAVGQYTAPPDSAWVPTGEEPRPIEWSMLFTAPYYSIINAGGNIDMLSAPDAVPAILAAQDSPDTFAVRLNLNGEDASEINLTPRAEIVALLPFEVTSVVSISAPTAGLPLVPGVLAVLGTTDENMEMCLVTNIVGNVITLDRGVLDTTPKVWSAGSAIWFLNPNQTFVREDVVPAGSLISYKLRTVTSLGVLDEDVSTSASGTLSERPHLPFRPADVKVNGVTHGTVDADGASSVTVTWSNRDRTAEDTIVLAWDDADVTPEDGQTTTVAVYAMDGTLITAHDDLPGTSFVLPASSFGVHARGLVKVTSKRDGKESIQGHGIEVMIAAGYGYSYGYNYGGA